MRDESLVDKAKETVGIGQTPSTQAAKSDRPLDIEKAFDALGASVVEEYGEWKPVGAPMDSFCAMHKGQMRMVGGSEMKDKIAYAFGVMCKRSTARKAGCSKSLRVTAKTNGNTISLAT